MCQPISCQRSHLSPPVSQILGLLTEKEVMSVVVTQAIVPRTFVLKPSMSLLVGGLARIDFLQVMTPAPMKPAHHYSQDPVLTRLLLALASFPRDEA